MNAYYFLWVLLIVVSLWASLGGFLWAHRSGQFKDQDRARFLPLRGESGASVPAAKSGARREAFVMAGIIAVGISAIITVLAIAAVRFHGGDL